MSRQSGSSAPLRLPLPKGRMEQAVLTLLGDAGIRIRPGARGYRPDVSLPDTQAKILKPQNIVEMLSLGSRDLGFAGADWVAELEANVVELLDTGLDPVQVVAAATTCTGSRPVSSSSTTFASSSATQSAPAKPRSRLPSDSISTMF